MSYMGRQSTLCLAKSCGPSEYQLQPIVGLNRSVLFARNMSDEVKKAQDAGPANDTVFGKILRKEIPSTWLHEDDKVIYCY